MRNETMRLPGLRVIESITVDEAVERLSVLLSLKRWLI